MADAPCATPPSPADTASLGVRDYLIVALLLLTAGAATVYLFSHPDGLSFGAWCTLMGTMVPCYHWLTVRDSKIPDAQP